MLCNDGGQNHLSFIQQHKKFSFLCSVKHANFVIPFLFVWRIILDEFIMLCIDYHQFLEG
jgi:hypothetical protein